MCKLRGQLWEICSWCLKLLQSNVIPPRRARFINSVIAKQRNITRAALTSLGSGLYCALATPELSNRQGMSRHYIGIDVGTGSARACIINEEGDIVADASKDISLWKPKEGYYVCIHSSQIYAADSLQGPVDDGYMESSLHCGQVLSAKQRH